MKSGFVKILSYILVMLMAMSVLLTGCGGQSEESISTTGTTSEVTKQQDTSTTVEKKEPVKITVWHPVDATSDVTYKNLFESISKELVDESIEVVFEPQTNANYKEVVTTASVAKQGADIIFIWSGPDFDTFASRGVYKELDSYYSQEKYDQLAGMEGAVYNGKTYCLPFAISTQLAFYNKALFQKAGVAPEDFTGGWESFKAACEKLKDAGIVPMSWANKEGYMNEWYLSIAATQSFADLKDYQENYLNKRDFTEQRYVDIINNMKYAHDNGFFYKGDTLDFGSNYLQKFLAGETAINYCGIYWLDQIKEAIGDDNVGMMYWPNISTSGKSRAIMYPVLYGIASYSQNADAAAKVLDVLTTRESASLIYKHTNMIPANKEWDFQKDVSGEVNQKAMELINKDQFISAYNYWNPKSLDAIYKEFSLIWSNNMTPEEWLKKFQEAQSLK